LNSLFSPWIIFIFWVFSLVGCTSYDQSIQALLKSSFKNQSEIISQTPLDSRYTYLRVNISGLDALMVRGYIDKDSNGSIDIWYSSDGSVLRIQNGRYLGSVGFDKNWRNVLLQNPPNLVKVISEFKRENASPQIRSLSEFYPTEQYFYTRSFTKLPENVTYTGDKVSLSLSKQAPTSIPKVMMSYLQNKEINWVSEKKEGDTNQKNINSTIAWYGFEKANAGFREVIVYQCLDTDFCITWMPWPIK
jgi:hypothetical protein